VEISSLNFFAFSVLTLLVVRQEEHPGVRKYWFRNPWRFHV